MKEQLSLNHLNLAFAENLYADFLKDPASVSADWAEYFRSLANGDPSDNGSVTLEPSFKPRSIFDPAPSTEGTALATGTSGSLSTLQERVDRLVRAYRLRGHMIARIDPLGLPRPTPPPELDPKFYGFTDRDMDLLFSCETVHRDGPLPLRRLIEVMENTYCRSIGVEYMHIGDLKVRRWMQERMEPTQNHLEMSRKEQLRILTRLTDAVTFEEFIRKKFIGAKSFSLEGSESLIPLIDLAIERAAEHGVQEIVFAMAHRGRLNVLGNIMGKQPREIFREFADKDPELYVGRGDVKYHKGYTNKWKLGSGRTVQLSLCFNPSHLEFVNPVAIGRIRAAQDRLGDKDRSKAMAFLIHGDAAFAGQGVTQETLNLSQLTGYSIGGTLHVITNNQIGFTTGPGEARSSTYATDVAKMLAIPIFHVNGEDPEAVAQCVNVALDFRAQFKRDVVIDMYGYRRLGHNESDEPSFTQPILYKAIEKRKPVREGYLDHLLKLNGITQKDADRIAEKRQEYFEIELAESQKDDFKPQYERAVGAWESYVGGAEPLTDEVKTGVPKERLKQLLTVQTQLPPDFHPHPKIEKWLANRAKMGGGEVPLDWSAGEALALASLATDGVRIRLSGQDSRRGTFSHRHATLHDYEDGHTYTPLQHLSPKQAPVDIHNSPLSEVGVLGFDYGYSLDCPNGLVMWEAQFGDFWNVAQVIVDQFIATAEDKWRHLSALVLLLPHGYEGQGPEHSSARLERFLNIAAEDNIQVVYPTTPAQFFHLLRRQVLRKWRKPLIVMSPKSLLRHPEVISSMDELAQGTFQRLIPDTSQKAPEQIKKILLCTGKIYYELAKKRESLKREDVAILRLEQLYPLPPDLISKALAGYSKDVPVVWVQEEPENMGAWRYMRVVHGEKIAETHPFSGISRPASSSPATGSANSHKQEQAEILRDAFK